VTRLRHHKSELDAIDQNTNDPDDIFWAMDSWLERNEGKDQTELARFAEQNLSKIKADWTEFSADASNWSK
jgi:hypothetical protein